MTTHKIYSFEFGKHTEATKKIEISVRDAIREAGLKPVSFGNMKVEAFESQILEAEASMVTLGINWLYSSLLSKDDWNYGNLAYCQTILFQNGYAHRTASGNWFAITHYFTATHAFTKTFLRVKEGGESEKTLLGSVISPALVEEQNCFLHNIIALSEANTLSAYESRMVSLGMSF